MAERYGNVRERPDLKCAFCGTRMKYIDKIWRCPKCGNEIETWDMNG